MRYEKSDFVAVPFPFTNFENSMRRPAVVISCYKDDVVLCPITTILREINIPLSDEDFAEGSLHKKSFVRQTRLLTIHSSSIIYKIRVLKKEKIDLIIEKIVEMLRR